MKKNIVKTMLKAAATTAMVAAMFVGGNKMEAKACYNDASLRLENGECVCSECYTAETGKNMWDDDYSYTIWYLKKEGTTMSEAEVRALVDDSLTKLGAGLTELEVSTTVSHTNLLNMVNTDRAANGAGNLAWNADLEAVARQRAYEVYLNAQSAEYVNALNTGDYATQAAIVHNGSREGIRENAIVSLYSGVAEETANQNWIASNGHHVVRINAGYTQYACASYTDPLTGVETWVEVFADNNFKSASTFDSARYAADYPDLAAAFGNDKSALYNHYITSGRKEGRKAYNTDGTTFK